MAMPTNTAVSSVKTYACTSATITSSTEISEAITRDGTPIPTPTIAEPVISAKRKTNEMMGRMAM